MNRIIGSRYWNTCGHATAIVAVRGNNSNWAAYIGGSNRLLANEEECLELVALDGAKLSEEDAVHFFPDIPLRYMP